jgi:hypothetical protein
VTGSPATMALLADIRHVLTSDGSILNQLTRSELRVLHDELLELLLRPTSDHVAEVRRLVESLSHGLPYGR